MYTSIIFIGFCTYTVCIIFGLQELMYKYSLLNTGKKYRSYSWQLNKSLFWFTLIYPYLI